MYSLSTPSSYLNYVFFSYRDKKSWCGLPPTEDYYYMNLFKIDESAERIDSKSRTNVFYIDKVEYEHFKTLFYVERRRKVDLPDFVSMRDGFHYVSKKFKEYIEAVDPGVHHFWKINLEEDGEAVDDYFRMQIGRFVDYEGSESTHYTSELREIFIQNLRSEDIEKSIFLLPFFSIKGDMKTIYVSDQYKEKIIKKGFVGIWDMDSKLNDSLGSCFNKIS